MEDGYALLREWLGEDYDRPTTAQMCLRGVIVLTYGVILVRLAGRRLFGRWTPMDIILSVLIGSNFSRTLTGNSPLIPTLVATTLLVVLHAALAHVANRVPLVSRLVKGRSTVLVRDGERDLRAMARAGMGDGDVEEALRQRGLERVDQAREIVLERNGEISIIPAKRELE